MSKFICEIDGRFAPIRVYEDIICVPFKILQHIPDVVHIGGPIYPDEEYLSPFPHRYFHSDAPKDTRPEVPKDYEVHEKPSAYVGVISNHFGHFIADLCVPRVWPIVASIDKNIDFWAWSPNPQKIPEFAKEILFGYFGVKSLKFIEKPIKVKKLYVAPQMERAKTGFYDENKKNLQEYLEFVDYMTDKYLHGYYNSELKHEIVFVSRKKLLDGLIGEEYIASLMELAGIKVVCPEDYSFKDQLYIYKNASILIFSEGTALHTLRFFGDLSKKKVIIINRRKGYLMDKIPLSDRRAEVHYLDYVEANFLRFAPAVCDMEAILQGLEDLIGIKLLKHFNRKDYIEACRNHIEKVISSLKNSKSPLRSAVINQILNFLTKKQAETNKFYITECLISYYTNTFQRLQPLIEYSLFPRSDLFYSLNIEQFFLDLIKGCTLSIVGIAVYRRKVYDLFVDDGREIHKVSWVETPNIGKIAPHSPNSGNARFIIHNLPFEYGRSLKFFIKTDEEKTIEVIKVTPSKRFVLNRIDIYKKVEKLVEFINIDNIAFDLFSNSISVGGVVVLFRYIEKDCKLIIEDAEGTKEVLWNLPSPACANMYKGNPFAEKARFTVKELVIQNGYPLRLYLEVDNTDRIEICEINVEFSIY